jgi:hypothetical protein
LPILHPNTIFYLQHQRLALQVIHRNGEFECLVEERIRVVAVDRRLSLAVVDLGKHRQLDVGVVEPTLLAAGQVMRCKRTFKGAYDFSWKLKSEFYSQI